jgi:hypothetical protein
MGHISSLQHLAFTWLYGGFGVALRRLYGAYRQALTEASDGLIMVGYGVLVADAQAPGLAELFDQIQDMRLRNGVA